ncbi:MAG: DUF4038 domain-containing protein [Bryobacterales bacterium]|nr:DUF4038 domain-containing protein [Bryobacterales bacterium]
MRRLLLVFLAVVPVWAVERFGIFETFFEASGEPLGQERLVEFRCGSAVERVPAFWDGGTTWKVRYMALAAGTCRWSALEGLPKKSGRFRVEVSKSTTNPLLARGPIRVAKNGRHFEHADGSPYFFLADTAWNAALWSTNEEWADYLADRAAKHFTAVQFVMTQWRAGRQDERGQTAFAVRDGVLTVNPAFFARLDRKFASLNQKGMVAAGVVLWALTSKDNESPGVALSVEHASQLARYMVARYQAHHTTWFLGGDGDYSGQNVARWQAIGRAVFPAGRRRGPVTLHPRGMRDPWKDYTGEAWVDYMVYQTGHGGDARKWKWNATAGPAEGWKLTPPRPVLDAEPNYEGHMSYNGKKIDDYAVRRASWYSVLNAPPAGITYGAHGIWFWSRKAEPPLDHARSGPAMPWRECLDYPGAKHMQVLIETMRSLRWWTLRPDRSLLASDTHREDYSDYVMPARSEDGSFALVYLPDGVSPSVVKTGGWARQTFVDPRSGVRTATRGAGDALLLLEK